MVMVRLSLASLAAEWKQELCDFFNRIFFTMSHRMWMKHRVTHNIFFIEQFLHYMIYIVGMVLQAH